MTDTIETLHHSVCDLGEGPTYDPYADTAWWLDITGRALHEFRFADRVFRVHDLPEAASALVRIDADRQVLCTETGLHLRAVETGALSPLAAIEADDPRTRSNDARVHPGGALWMGTMGWEAEAGAGAIYHYREGTLTRLYSDVTIPNAICFSPDGRVGYFGDTAANAVYRVALSPETGLPQGEPELWRDTFDGGADGAVVDSEGCLLIAIWGAGVVVRFDPSGEEIGRIDLPARQPSCPAFVGRDADRLLVTTAATGLSAPGAADGLCHVAELTVPGLHASDMRI